MVIYFKSFTTIIKGSDSHSLPLFYSVVVFSTGWVSGVVSGVVVSGYEGSVVSGVVGSVGVSTFIVPTAIKASWPL